MLLIMDTQHSHIDHTRIERTSSWLLAQETDRATSLQSQANGQEELETVEIGVTACLEFITQLKPTQMAVQLPI